MTTMDTPLADVARLLPAEQAGRLLQLSPEEQETTLKDIRFVIHKWEQSGLELDPITFEKALGPVADMLAILNMALLKLLEEK